MRERERKESESEMREKEQDGVKKKVVIREKEC